MEVLPFGVALGPGNIIVDQLIDCDVFHAVHEIEQVAVVEFLIVDLSGVAGNAGNFVCSVFNGHAQRSNLAQATVQKGPPVIARHLHGGHQEWNGAAGKQVIQKIRIVGIGIDHIAPNNIDCAYFHGYRTRPDGININVIPNNFLYRRIIEQTIKPAQYRIDTHAKPRPDYGYIFRLGDISNPELNQGFAYAGPVNLSGTGLLTGGLGSNEGGVETPHRNAIQVFGNEARFEQGHNRPRLKRAFQRATAQDQGLVSWVRLGVGRLVYGGLRVGSRGRWITDHESGRVNGAEICRFFVGNQNEQVSQTILLVVVSSRLLQSTISREMPLTVADIQIPIAAEMNLFEQKFRDMMKSDVMLLDQIMNYIVKRKGKQLRPMFVFLTAGVCGQITEATYRGASLIELLHTATLVHDDVVDESNYRRGFFSINALWKNKVAILVGDYLLSRGLLLSVDNGDFELLQIVSTAVRELSEGELLQIQKARRLDIDEPVYYEIIRQKTASLIAACCAVGARSVNADKAIVEQARTFGEKVGIAFQIKDDLFDYGTAEVGKPLGIDIKEKKMTLPLIYALNNAGFFEKRRIINIVKNESDNPKKVAEVIDFVKQSGGIAYATEAMNKYVAEAQTLLNAFPDSDYRQSLHQLVQYTIDRSK